MAVGSGIRTTRTISSDKDVNFTGDIAQNAIENESITFPGDMVTAGIQKVMITGIGLQLDASTAGAALEFDLIIWNTGDYANTDLDLDGMITVVKFSTSDATQVAGTGQYYYENQSDFKLPIDYHDTDNTSKLHIGLINRSATTYTGTSDDKVKVNFTVEPFQY